MPSSFILHCKIPAQGLSSSICPVESTPCHKDTQTDLHDCSRVLPYPPFFHHCIKLQIFPSLFQWGLGTRWYKHSEGTLASVFSRNNLMSM